MAKLTTPSLIEYLMSAVDMGEWVKFTGTHRGESSPHWFKISKKGSPTIFHRSAEQGPIEGLSQPSVIHYYKNFRWERA